MMTMVMRMTMVSGDNSVNILKRGCFEAPTVTIMTKNSNHKNLIDGLCHDALMTKNEKMKAT